MNLAWPIGVLLACIGGLISLKVAYEASGMTPLIGITLIVAGLFLIVYAGAPR
jgi:uncharacterized membrane protein HdeD (DUF308 family)